MKEPSKDDYRTHKKEELVEELLWMRRINEAQAKALMQAGLKIDMDLLKGVKNNG